jgi:uncharacterized protein YkwD
MKTLTLILFSLFTFSLFSQTSSLEKEIYKVINEYKIKLNKNSVVLDDTLSSQSRVHTTWMVETGLLEHAEYIKAHGEIIQRTNNIDCTEYQVAKKVLTNFLNSPSHKEIIDEQSRIMGVGVIVEEIGYVWVTIRFR